MTRLTLGTVARKPPLPERIGIVHLGLGAFHRAHQAVYTEDAMAATGDRRWGILGVSQRSGRVGSTLAPQDHLYTVVEQGAGAAPPRVVGALRGVLDASVDPTAVVDQLATPDIRIVTLTVTEKGYRHDPATRELRLDDEEIAADLTARPPRTVVGQLVRGLQRRAATGAGPITVMCCDNLPDNGRFLRRLVSQFLDAAGLKSLAAWTAENVRFPSTMVDRIVPSTTEEDIAEARDRTGLVDEALVVAEPFRQWVIEDDFAAARPAWEQVGAQLVGDVEPWEVLKLRTLNASHSLLAYLGLLAGHPTIADAVTDPLLREACRRLIAEDVAPAVVAPSGVDAIEYGDTVLARFGNRALRHTTAQVGSDGSQKLGPRLLGTALDRLAVGGDPRWVALTVAAWLCHVLSPTPLDDPLAEVLRTAADGAKSTEDAAVRLLGVEQVFPPELVRYQRFREHVLDLHRRLSERDIRSVLAEELRGGEAVR